MEVSARPLILHVDMGVPQALCHMAPLYATKSWTSWLISKGKSHLHVGNGLLPTLWCPWLEIPKPWAADAAGITAQPCWAALSLVEWQKSRCPWMAWMCSSGSTALPSKRCFHGRQLCHGPSSQGQLCFPTKDTGRGAGNGRRSHSAAPWSGHFVVPAPLTQERFKEVPCTSVLYLIAQSKPKHHHNSKC